MLFKFELKHHLTTTVAMQINRTATPSCQCQMNEVFVLRGSCSCFHHMNIKPSTHMNLVSFLRNMPCKPFCQEKHTNETEKHTCSVAPICSCLEPITHLNLAQSWERQYITPKYISMINNMHQICFASKLE